MVMIRMMSHLRRLGRPNGGVLTHARIENLLYSRPELYELVYPEPDDETPNLCRRLFARYLDSSTTRGRDLEITPSCA